jgi:prevent-host-death family protein
VKSVTAAELQKNFGRWRDAAQKESVIVTAHGKPSVAIVGIAEFERLRALDRRTLRLDEMADTEIEAMIAAEIPPELRYSIESIPERPADDER